MDGFTSHGGQLQAAMRAWPGASGPWIDLSTGINPKPYPAPRASLGARARLPFAEEIADLEAVAARAFGLGGPDRIVATAGAEAALRLLPELLEARTAVIVGPTYASHADAWSRAGARLAADEDEAGAVILVNPNNPDGAVRAPAALLALADRLAARDGWLVVDESFADVAPGPSLAAAGHPRIVVLRSFGKFFGLAGLRLGFIAGPADLVRRVRGRQGDWPVGADALAAGRAAYADADWISRTRRRLARDAARLDHALLAAGFRIVGGTLLFRLTASDDAGRRFEALCARGVLTRPFADQPDWLRFGLPHPSMWRRVEDALRCVA
jgi:cobalamin biosynthetic protein CobC